MEKKPKKTKTPKPRNPVVREMLANPNRNAGKHKNKNGMEWSNRSNWPNRTNWTDVTLGGTEE